MKKIIANIFFKVSRWKIKIDGDSKSLDRCVLVVAPHTSNWDFILGILTYWKLGKKLKIIIKDSHTKAFYGKIVEKMGGIGINRAQKNDLVNFVASAFEKEDFSLVITPEGSRSWSPKWHLGFYYMARKAEVPIVLASGDYQKKEIQIGYTISVEKIEQEPLEVILVEIEDYFRNIQGKFPKNYNPQIYER